MDRAGGYSFSRPSAAAHSARTARRPHAARKRFTRRADGAGASARATSYFPAATSANTATIRLLRRRGAAPGWWVLLVVLWTVGVALGIYGGFFFEYHASPTLRVFGAPVPAAFFHWEGPPGQEGWVDFPAETALLNAASNVLLLPLLLACPLGAIFWSWRKLRPSGPTRPPDNPPTQPLGSAGRSVIMPGMIRCLFGALLLLATGGCRYEASSHPTVSGTDASLLVGASDSDKPVRVGRSTREQVRAELGDPDHATADRSVWTYEWSILSGRWFALGGSYERRDVRTLVLRFDDAGVLASRELLHSDATPGRPNARTPLPPEIVDEIYRPPVGTRLGQDGAGDVRE